MCVCVCGDGVCVCVVVSVCVRVWWYVCVVCGLCVSEVVGKSAELCCCPSCQAVDITL